MARPVLGKIPGSKGNPFIQPPGRGSSGVTNFPGRAKIQRAMHEPALTTNGNIDITYFTNLYTKDSLNKKIQTLDTYLDWVDSFYEGSFLFDGWTERTASLLKKVAGGENKAALRKELNSLGKIIGGEWARDNSIRKIDTDDIKIWGKKLIAARDVDNGDGSKILEMLSQIKLEIGVKLGP